MDTLISLDPPRIACSYCRPVASKLLVVRPGSRRGYKGCVGCGCGLFICHLKTKINKLETTENPLSAKRSFWLVRYIQGKN